MCILHAYFKKCIPGYHPLEGMTPAAMELSKVVCRLKSPLWFLALRRPYSFFFHHLEWSFTICPLWIEGPAFQDFYSSMTYHIDNPACILIPAEKGIYIYPNLDDCLMKSHMSTSYENNFWLSVVWSTQQSLGTNTESAVHCGPTSSKYRMTNGCNTDGNPQNA